MSDILIVGAGPVGVTLAIELLRRNISVRLIDLAEEPLKGSRGKGIQPRTLESFDMMDVIDEILQSSDCYLFSSYKRTFHGRELPVSLVISRRR